MDTSKGAIKYIYKIAPSAPIPSWPKDDPRDGSSSVLPPSDLDLSSGFIHMSIASQIPGTLKHFFPTSSNERNVVYLLKVPLTNEIMELHNVLRWESPDASVCGPRGGEGLFPHLYFRDSEDTWKKRLFIKKHEVESIMEATSAFGTVGWDDSLEKLVSEQWLV